MSSVTYASRLELCGLAFEITGCGDAICGVFPMRSDRALRLPESAATVLAAEQLTEYFHGGRRRFDLPLAEEGTEFQMEVWRALRDIPWGSTLTYGELAASLGRPGAARAVGGAAGKNPLLIITPCHRLLASGGRLGGFSAGLPLKETLLRLEGVTLQ